MKKGEGFLRYKWSCIVVIIFILSVAFVYAVQTNVNTRANFDDGTYTNVFYNSSGFVQLDLSGGNFLGNYTSKVFDIGASSSWVNVSWTEGVPYKEELPSNNLVELVLGGANMTGNVLLFHFNNDSSYSENDTHIFDFSGTGSNGTVTNAAFSESGKFGAGAFSFDGAGDYVSIADSANLDLTSEMSFSMWVKLNSVPSNQFKVLAKSGVNGTIGVRNVSTNDLAFFGADDGENLGTAFAYGDFNNDGIGDLAMGAYNKNSALALGTGEGETYIFYGPINESGIFNVSTANITLFGIGETDNSGSAATSGDFNNDGIDDLVIGARWANNSCQEQCGEAYVLYGPLNNSGTFNLSIANVTFYGKDSIDYLGISASNGDFNNDGLDDLALGAYGVGGFPLNNGWGETYILYGPLNDSGVFNISVANVTLVGGVLKDWSGRSIGYGDLNNDNLGDLVIGARNALAGGTARGQVYVLYGPILNSLYNLTTDVNLTFNGSANSDNAGAAVNVGDFNNDGFDDLLIGAMNAEGAGESTNSAGEAYILYGPLTDNLILNETIANFTFFGMSQTSRVGSGLQLGDFNNDGINDLAIGAYSAEDYGQPTDAGEVYLFYGPLQYTSNYEMSIDEELYPVFYADKAVKGSANISLDNYTFIASTLNATHLTIWVNNESVSRDISASPTANDLALYLGSFVSGSEADFNGTIDELSIWNRSLSDTEIFDIYKRGILDLNMTFRSCNNSACTGIDWNETYTSPSANLSINSSQYLQFRFDFLTENLAYSSQLYNLSFIDPTTTPPANEETTTNTNSNAPPAYSVDKTQLEQGYERILGEGFKLIFDIGDDEVEGHTLTVEDISVNRVRITIKSNPITFDLGINETKKLDLNRDGFYDFEIFLKEIKWSSANFVFKKIREKVVSNELVQENRSETTADNEAGGGETVSANKTTIKVIIALLVLVILLVIIIILVVKRRRHRKIWGY